MRTLLQNVPTSKLISASITMGTGDGNFSADLSDLRDVYYDILVFFSPSGIDSLFNSKYSSSIKMIVGMLFAKDSKKKVPLYEQMVSLTLFIRLRADFLPLYILIPGNESRNLALIFHP